MENIPTSVLKLLYSHIAIQDSLFLEGYCNCLSYQYPHSALSRFYDDFDFVDSPIPFKESLKQFFHSTYFVDGKFL